MIPEGERRTELATNEKTTERVRDRYAIAALTVLDAQGSACDLETGLCDSTPSPVNTDPITSDLYSAEEQGFVPLDAITASLGCGNPTALAQLNEGDVVLDLGSGGGVDVLLSARRVGPTGHAYGVDMTDEMLQLAEANKVKAGAENVTFLKGTIDAVPLPDASVDVIISNCVINLAGDKADVLREAFRLLKPGGRFAVSDVVTQGELPDDLKADMEAWIGCIAGALEENTFRQLLADAGFQDIEIQVTREYDPRELQSHAGAVGQACCSGGGCCSGDTPAVWDGSAYQRFEQSGGKIVSAFVRATKPEQE